MQDVTNSLAVVRVKIAAAAERVGRDASAVRIVAVTKTFPPETIRAALEAGIREFGENRVQEAEPKIRAIEEWCANSGQAAPKWHLVGHLQRNKVNAALGLFGVIQSVDSLRLAQAIDDHAEGETEVYLEVNVSGEESKFGFAPEEVATAVGAVANLEHVQPAGLMTVAPIAEDDVVRSVFRGLRELRDANGLEGLSMGMSDDFEIAVEEGATCLRLGRVLFGERPQ
jgi:PLP dependent protein